MAWFVNFGLIYLCEVEFLWILQEDVTDYGTGHCLAQSFNHSLVSEQS